MTILDAFLDPAKRWQAFGTVLANSLSEVTPTEPAFPWFPGWLERLSSEQHAQGDSLSRQFAQEWKWPPVAGELRFQLFLRTLFAMEVCYQRYSLLVRPPPKEPQHHAATFERLLIHDWKCDHLVWAHARYPKNGPPKPWQLSRPTGDPAHN